MFLRGTLQQFESWHETAKISENIPQEGKVGYLKGKLAINRQKTINYSDAIKHPINENDYIWLCGNYCTNENLDLEQVKLLGWFNDE